MIKIKIKSFTILITRTAYPEGVTVEAGESTEASLENGILKAVFPITSKLADPEPKLLGKRKKNHGSSEPPKKLQKQQIEEDTGAKNKREQKKKAKNAKKTKLTKTIEPVEQEQEQETEQPKETKKQKKQFTTVSFSIKYFRSINNSII